MKVVDIVLKKNINNYYDSLIVVDDIANIDQLIFQQYKHNDQRYFVNSTNGIVTLIKEKATGCFYNLKVIKKILFFKKEKREKIIGEFIGCEDFNYLFHTSFIDVHFILGKYFNPNNINQINSFHCVNGIIEKKYLKEFLGINFFKKYDIIKKVIESSVRYIIVDK